MAANKQPKESSLIVKELKRLEKQINEIFEALESIDLTEFLEPDKKLKAVEQKVAISLKLPLMLSSLDDLRRKESLRKTSIKGKKNLSPLESGEI